jgi:hypothetical protein
LTGRGGAGQHTASGGGAATGSRGKRGRGKRGRGENGVGPHRLVGPHRPGMDSARRCSLRACFGPLGDRCGPRRRRCGLLFMHYPPLRARCRPAIGFNQRAAASALQAGSCNRRQSRGAWRVHDSLARGRLRIRTGGRRAAVAGGVPKGAAGCRIVRRGAATCGGRGGRPGGCRGHRNGSRIRGRRDGRGGAVPRDAAVLPRRDIGPTAEGGRGRVTMNTAGRPSGGRRATVARTSTRAGFAERGR